MKSPFLSLGKEDPARYLYLLWFKFVLINLFFVALFVLAFLQGWVDVIFAKDPNVSWLSALTTFHPQTSFIAMMSVVFLIGLFFSFQKVFTTSREINYLKLPEPPSFSHVAHYLRQIKGAESGSRSISFSATAAKWGSKQTVVRFLANMETALGLLGTVLGFALAVLKITDDSVGSISTVKPLIAGLVSGLGLAVYTTIAGGFLGELWLKTNWHLIQNGSIYFLALVKERGEKDSNSETA